MCNSLLRIRSQEKTVSEAGRGGAQQSCSFKRVLALAWSHGELYRVNCTTVNSLQRQFIMGCRLPLRWSFLEISRPGSSHQPREVLQRRAVGVWLGKGIRAGSQWHQPRQPKPMEMETLWTDRLSKEHMISYTNRNPLYCIRIYIPQVMVLRMHHIVRLD